VCYWIFDRFLFIENLVVNEPYRGRGLASSLINELKTINRILVSEVEPMDTDNPITVHRIKFYEKKGFVMNDYFYERPPISRDSDYIQMKIVSYQKKLTEDEFLYLKDLLYRHVYDINYIESNK